MDEKVSSRKVQCIINKFDQTLEDEWINVGHFTTDIVKFNRELAGRIEEYNFMRPHQTLDYDIPFEYYLKTLSMYPDSVLYCIIS